MLQMKIASFDWLDILVIFPGFPLWSADNLCKQYGPRSRPT